MAERRSSRLAEKREVAETFKIFTLDDISSPSYPEWDDEGPDYEVEAHNSEIPSDSEISLGDEDGGRIGDDRAPDEFESATILELPKDSVESTIDDDRLVRICLKHGILKRDTLVLPKTNRPHNPPEGFMAITRLMCLVGDIPPFPPFVVDFLRQMRISPMQLHSNSYAYLYTLYIAYKEVLGIEPTFDDIHFFL